jgi:hypothetical protein
MIGVPGNGFVVGQFHKPGSNVCEVSFYDIDVFFGMAQDKLPLYEGFTKACGRPPCKGAALRLDYRTAGRAAAHVSEHLILLTLIS